MFKIINYIITLLLPITPRIIIKIFANKYIAGVNSKQALKSIRTINRSNMKATLDILGEHTQTKEEAIEITQHYVKLLKQIKKQHLDCNISIKPSHIGSDIDIDLLNENFKNITKEANRTNNFVRLDMEDNKLTNLTIKLFNDNYQYSKNIGIVFQAYLYRTKQDILNLDKGTNIRLCKGIYNESSSIAIKDPDKINQNYIKLLKLGFDKNIFIGIATHDKQLIDECCKIIKEKNIDKSNFEFQVLYGVPITKTIKKLLANNYKVRVYVPYGRDWYKYSMRRLKENPNISKYILGNLFKKNFYK